MYIITANGRSNIYHLAIQHSGQEIYSTACGYYTYVLPGGKNVMVVYEVSDDRRRCKRCDALVVKVQS